MAKQTNNRYTDLPTLEYVGNPILRTEIQTYIDSLNATIEQKTAIMTVVRKEALGDSTGKYKIPINNNLVNAQSDVDRWPNKSFEKYFIGTVKYGGRWFLAFDTWQHSIDFMLDRTKTRGMYVGGFAKKYAQTLIDSVDTYVTAYFQEWVRGEHILSEPIPSQEYRDIKRIYNQEYKYFSESIQKKNRQVQQYLSTFVAHSNYNIHFFLFGK